MEPRDGNYERGLRRWEDRMKKSTIHLIGAPENKLEGMG